MRSPHVFCRLMILLVATSLPSPAVLFAAPFTSFGPGGYEDDNGADNLVLWLNAGKGVFADNGSGGVGAAASPTDPVRQWQDQSGYANHANQTTAAAQATLQSGVLNSQPAIRFSSSGTGDTYSTSLSQPATMTTFIAYANRTGTGTLQSATAAHDQIQRDTDFWFDSSVGNITVAGDTANTSRLMTMQYNYTAQQYSVFLDGTQRGASAGTGQKSTGVVLLGARAGTGEFLDGDILEMVIMNRIVSSVERTVTENYLASKYNTDSVGTFAIGNDKYSGDTLAKGNFDFGVFGIGDDGTSELDNAGMEGMGIEVAAGSLTGSNQWVLAGHDSGANGITTADMLSNTERWQRSWFVDTTNVSTADLAFDWNDAGNTAPFSPAYTGLYYRLNNSGTFTLLAVGTLDTLNQRVDFSGVSLPVGDGYFTLGSLPVPEPSTLALLGLGVVGMVANARRRRRAAA